MSPIDLRYQSDTYHQSLAGLLGDPLHEERSCKDGVGRFRTYERGSIHWHPRAGAYETHGAIRDYWAKLGWEQSPLGYPLSDEEALSKSDLNSMRSPSGLNFLTFFDEMERGHYTDSEYQNLQRQIKPQDFDPSYARISRFQGGAIVYVFARGQFHLLSRWYDRYEKSPRYIYEPPRSLFAKLMSSLFSYR